MSTRKEGCTDFPDIYERASDTATEAEKKAIHEANEKREKVYRAVRYILMNDFGFSEELPAEPRDFPGNLNDKQQAMFVAIYGTMGADNYESPNLGRTFPQADDLVIPGDNYKPPRTTILVARRFADAVVAAVQEYTSRAKLFNNVFGFMKDEATQKTQAPQRSTV